MGNQIALEGGASEESFEAWNEDMIENENVPEDFDWREHVDFSASPRSRRSSASSSTRLVEPSRRRSDGPAAEADSSYDGGFACAWRPTGTSVVTLDRRRGPS